MKLTTDQLVEMLEHDGPNDVWLLNEDGSTSIVPDQDIAEFQNPGTWPKYICRSSAVDAHVRTKGVEEATAYINGVIEITGLGGFARPAKLMASLTRSAVTSGYRAIRGSKTTS